MVVGVVGGVRQQAAAVVEGQPRHAPLAGEAGLELRPDEVRALGRVDALQVDGQTLREREDPGLAFGLGRSSKRSEKIRIIIFKTKAFNLKERAISIIICLINST